MKTYFLDDLYKFNYDGTGQSSYIYFITFQFSNKHEHLNRVKIGISKNPEKRRRAFQTGNPIPVRLWYKFPINNEKKFYLESELHSKFKRFKMKGQATEWFKIHPCIKEFVKAHKEMMLRKEEKQKHSKKYILRKKN